MRNQDLFRYYQLRDYYNKKRKVKVNDIHPLTKMMMAPYEHTLPRIISYLYEVLMCSGPSSTIYIKLKWDKELKIEITETDWYDLWSIHQTTTSSQIWREFCWKCLIRFFITPKIRNKQVSGQQTCWRQCGQLEADHTHIFWSCEKIQSFWDDVQVVMSEVFGFKIPRTSMFLLMGNIKGIIPKSDQYDPACSLQKKKT